MASKYFQPGTEHAAKVQDLFATVAPRYDLINDLQSFGWHRIWKRRLFTLAAPQPGESALDVCCGTGDIALALARSGAKTTGFDFSPAMLARARQRAAHQPAGSFPPPEFIQGDALQLPFRDGSFTLVTISYGLRNLSNFNRGLQELTRVLAPAGRLVVLDFGKPDNAVWRWLYFQHLRWICPLFGRLFCGETDTHSYILDSLKNYPAQRGVDDALRSLNYRDCQLENLFGGMMSINYGRKAG